MCFLLWENDFKDEINICMGFFRFYVIWFLELIFCILRKIISDGYIYEF